MPSRRRFLGLATVAALAGAAGCTAKAPSGEHTAIVPRQEPLEMGDHVRATADVITTEQTVTDSNLTYIPENGTVRYPATTSGGEVVSYGTISFDVWAEIEAVEAGARTVQDELDATIPGERMSTTSIANHGDIPIHVGVDHLTVVNEDGDVVYETPVSARELVNRVPRSVTATIHFAGQTATNTVPVYVEKVWRDCGAPLDVSCPEPAE